MTSSNLNKMDISNKNNFKVFYNNRSSEDIVKRNIIITNKLIKDNLKLYFNNGNKQNYKNLYKDIKNHKTNDISQVDNMSQVKKFNNLIKKIENVNEPSFVNLSQNLMPLRCFYNAKFIEKITNGELKKVIVFILIYHPDLKCLTTETHAINKDEYGNYYDFTKEHLIDNLKTKVIIELSRVNNLPNNYEGDKFDTCITDYLNQYTFYLPSKQTGNKLKSIQEFIYERLLKYDDYNKYMDYIERTMLIRW
jgi:hypothetical protein